MKNEKNHAIRNKTDNRLKIFISKAKQACEMALVGRNQNRLNSVSNEIKSANASAPLVIVADVTTEAERIISETVKHFGKLDILINSAGVIGRSSIESVDLADYDHIMNVNVRSVIELIKLAVPHLTKTKGNILNVSSAAGLRVKPNLLSYCISKAAVNQMTKSAALDLAPKGIRVNAINPVTIRTPLFESGWGLTAQQADEMFENCKDIYPMRRAGEVTDTTAAIEYLISDSASFITGALFGVDGGGLTSGK